MPKGKENQRIYKKSEISRARTVVRVDYKLIYADAVPAFEKALNGVAEEGYTVELTPFMQGTKIVAVTQKPVYKEYLVEKATGEPLPPNAHIEEDELEAVAHG